MSYQIKEEKAQSAINILLVDDRQENLIALEALLKAENDSIHYIACRSGAAALKIAIKEEIALILLDVQMPEMDGYEVARLLKYNSKTSSIPIIFVTAIDRKTDEVLQGFESGAVDFLFKPLDPSITKAKVSAFVKIHLQNKELQQKNQLLKEKQQIIEETQHLAGISTWEWQLPSQTISFSEPLASLFDLEASRAIPAETYLATIHPEDRAYMQNLLQSPPNLNEYVWYDYRALVKGKVLYIAGKYKVERDAFQQVTRLSGYSQNITSLRESQVLLERTFHISPYGICALTAVRNEEEKIIDFEIVRANQATARLLERNTEAIAGQRLLSVFPLLNERGLFGKYIDVVESDAVVDTEHLYQPDGNSKWFRILAIRLDEGLLLTFNDISQRKKAEQQLKLAHQDLATANQSLVRLNNQLEERVEERTKELLQTESELRTTNVHLRRTIADLDNFVYTASHDLKSPLNNIEGLMYHIKKYLPTNDEKAEQLLTMMQQSITRFKNILNELGEIADLESNDESASDNVSFQLVVEETKQQLSEEMKRSEAQITVDLEIASIQFSRKNLRSIMYNLISNAIKYRSPGRAPQVQVRTYHESDFIVLAIKDNGLGIRQESISRIFDLFKRLHSHEEGMGIGLFLVRKIVEDTGGKIEVASEVGKGSEFKIYLNVKRASKLSSYEKRMPG